METGINLTGYDFVVIGIFALFIARGIWLGLLKQVTGLLALCLGYYVASQYHDRLFPFLKDISENPKVVFVASVVILFIGTYVVAMLIGRVLAYVIEITISKWFDRSLGAILGVVKAAIVVIFLHMLLSSILAPENAMLRECQTCNVLNKSTEYARAIIQDEEVRKALMQQTPAISAEDVREFFETKPQAEEPEVDQEPSSPVE